MKYLFVITLVTQALLSFGQECEKLADGRYLFKHKTKGCKRIDFILTITGNTYSITRNKNDSPKEEIKWYSDCTFKVGADDHQIKVKTDTVTKLQKRLNDVSARTDVATLLRNTFLSYGGYCYEITNGRKFRITYCGNSHITIAEGRIVRK